MAISPRVSVGLPVYNGARYLRQSVQSILDQDFEDLELIISDNASTDDTGVICRDFAERDRRVRYYRNQVNVGASKNFNLVFNYSRGEFFKWAAHDDECYRSMIRRCIEVFAEAPASVVLVYPLAELIDDLGNTLDAPLDRIASKDNRPSRRMALLLWALNMCNPVFGLIKTDYLKKTQLIGPFFGADYVLLAELAMLGQIWELDEVLFRLRNHAGRSMQANKDIRSRTSWYDPSAAKKRFLLPVWEQMVWELFKSVCRSGLTPVEKLRCCCVVPGVHYWKRFRNAGGRAKRRLIPWRYTHPK